MPRTLALILAGGRVDELSVLTLHRPKSAVFFGGMYRVIDFPLSNLMNSGIERVGILSQYRSASLINHIGVGASWDLVGRNRGVSLLPPQQGVAGSDWYKGTSDAVYQNIEFLQEYPHTHTLILSGDHVYQMDYHDMIQYHEEKNADVTAAFVRVPREGASRFGLGEVDDEDGERGGRLVDYVEKPDHPLYSWASMTIYPFRRELLVEAVSRQANHDSSWEFGRDILPSLLANHKVYAYKHKGYWAYSRTIEEYWQANMDFLDSTDSRGFDAWQVRTNLDDKNLRDRPPAYVAAESSIHNSRLTYGCRVEGEVTGSILFPGVSVEKGAVVRDSILFPDVRICRGARVNRLIADEKSVIGPNAVIGAGDDNTPNRAFPDLLSTGITLVGKETILPERISIGKNCIIPPFLSEEHLTSKSYPSGVLLT